MYNNNNYLQANLNRNVNNNISSAESDPSDYNMLMNDSNNNNNNNNNMIMNSNLQYTGDKIIVNRNRTHLLSVACPYTAKLARIMQFTEMNNRKLQSRDENCTVVDLDLDHMKMIKEIVLPEMDGLITFLTQQVATKKLDIKYANKIILLEYKKIFERNWEPLIKESFDGYIAYGLILFRMQPHIDLFKVPVMLDPFDYKILYRKNEFNKNEYRIFDKQGNDLTKDIFIDVMYQPDSNGQVTSPIAGLILPTIEHIIRMAAYEQTLMQQLYPDRVISNLKPQSNADDNNDLEEEEDPNAPAVKFKNTVVKMPDGTYAKQPDNLRGSNAILTNNSKRLKNNAGNTANVDASLLHIYKNQALTGGSTDSLEREKLFMEYMKDSALLIHPANDKCSTSIWQLAPGLSLGTLPPATAPPDFLALLDRYEQICSKKLNLPIDITNAKPHGHMFSSETNFVTKRIKEAAFWYAQRTNQVFNLMISDIYGTSSHFLAILREKMELTEKIALREKTKKKNLKRKQLEEKNNNNNNSSSESESDSELDDNGKKKKKKPKVTRVPKQMQILEEKQNEFIVARTVLANMTTNPESETVDTHVNSKSQLENHQTDETNTKEAKDRNDRKPGDNKHHKSIQSKLNEMKDNGVVNPQTNTFMHAKFDLKANNGKKLKKDQPIIDEEEMLTILDMTIEAESILGNSSGFTITVNWLRDIEEMSWRDRLENNQPVALEEFTNKINILSELLHKYSGGQLEESEKQALQNHQAIETYNTLYNNKPTKYMPMSNSGSTSMNDPFNLSMNLKSNTYSIGNNNGNAGQSNYNNYNNNNNNNNNNKRKFNNNNYNNNNSNNNNHNNNPNNNHNNTNNDDDDDDDDGDKKMNGGDKKQNFKEQEDAKKKKKEENQLLTKHIGDDEYEFVPRKIAKKTIVLDKHNVGHREELVKIAKELEAKEQAKKKLKDDKLKTNNVKKK
jgi:hypothetical protein